MIRTLVASLAVVAIASPLAAQTVPAGPAITAQGDAIIKRAPDRAWVSIANDARASRPAEAQKKGAEAMTAVHAMLKKLGLPEDTIRTTNYSLQPEMDYQNGRATVRGYVAHNEVEVRLDDIAKLGELLDAAGVSGATTISQLRWDIKNRAGAEREALTLAVGDAMARARAMAEGVRRTLGEIVEIQEQRAGRPMPMMRMAGDTMTMSAEARQTPVAPGEIEIQAQVVLRIGIK